MARPRGIRRDRSITVAAPRRARQVIDKELWADGRKKIAEAALSLFLRYGYHATPVRSIAAAANFSTGSVFNYFSGKEQILEFILDESQAAAERVASEGREMLASSKDENPVASFLRVFRRYAEFADRMHRYVLLAYQETKSLAPKQRSPLFDRERRIAELLKAAAEPAIRAGSFSGDALDLRVHALIILAQAWAVRHWAWSHYPTVSDYLDDLMPLAVGIMTSTAAPYDLGELGGVTPAEAAESQPLLPGSQAERRAPERPPRRPPPRGSRQ